MTPAPWTRNGNVICHRSGHSYRPVAKVLPCCGGEADSHAFGFESENEANSRLIEAAPDLLAAARLANEELLALGAGSSGSPALRALWEAIAKAEGAQ